MTPDSLSGFFYLPAVSGNGTRTGSLHGEGHGRLLFLRRAVATVGSSETNRLFRTRYPRKRETGSGTVRSKGNRIVIGSSFSSMRCIRRLDLSMLKVWLGSIFAV